MGSWLWILHEQGLKYRGCRTEIWSDSPSLSPVAIFASTNKSTNWRTKWYSVSIYALSLSVLIMENHQGFAKYLYPIHMQSEGKNAIIIFVKMQHDFQICVLTRCSDYIRSMSLLSVSSSYILGAGSLALCAGPWVRLPSLTSLSLPLYANYCSWRGRVGR